MLSSEHPIDIILVFSKLTHPAAVITRVIATLFVSCPVTACNAASSANFDYVVSVSSSFALAVPSPTSFLPILYFTVTPASGQ